MMNALLAVLSVIIILWFVVSQFIKSRRRDSIHEMTLLYDEMEMYFIRKNIKIDKEIIEFLTMFKNLVVNPSLLDIQILLITAITEKKSDDLRNSKEMFEKTKSRLDSDFDKLLSKFDSRANGLILLSFFTPDFVWFAIKESTKLVIVSGISKLITKTKNSLKYVFDNEQIISYVNMNRNMAA